MLLFIGIAVVVVIILVLVLAYVLTGESEPAPLVLPVAPPKPAYVPIAPGYTPVPAAPAYTPVQTAPVTAPTPIATMSPASAPTPPPTITPVPIVTTATAHSGLPSGYANGDVVREPSGGIFKIENGLRRSFPNMTVYQSWGSPAFKPIALATLNSIPAGSPMEQRVTTSAPTVVSPTTTTTSGLPAGYANGDVVREPSGGIFKLESGKRRAFPNMTVYQSWGSPAFKPIALATLNAIPVGPPMEQKTSTSAPVSTSTSAPVSTSTPMVSLPSMPVLYADKSYGGAKWQIPGVGLHPLTGTGVKNDVSSIAIPAGWRLSVYDKDDCTGNMALYTSSMATLEGTGFNNDIACVKLARA